MSSTSPPQISRKIPAVAIVIDSTITLFSKWNCIIYDYCNHLLERLQVCEGNPFLLQPLVGIVTYGALDPAGFPVFVKRSFTVGGHNELKDNPATFSIGRTGAGGSLRMSALEGCATVIEMFDTLQDTGSVYRKQKEEFSYHLWHFVAGQSNDARHPLSGSTSILDGLTWRTIPAEFKKRNINYSSILVRSPKFETLLFAIANTHVSRPIYPHYTIPSSDFASPPEPGVPSTVPAKRRAESSAENRARGSKTVNPPWQINVLTPVPEAGLLIPPTVVSLPPPLSTSLALPPSTALSSTSSKPPACEPQDMSFLQLTSLAELAIAATQQTTPPLFESSASQQAPPIQSSLARQLPTSQPQSRPQMQPQPQQWCPLDFYQRTSAGFGGLGVFEAPQAGLTGEANQCPVTHGRRMGEYETDLLMGSGAVAAAQVHRPSHPAPNTVSHSMARLSTQLVAAIQNPMWAMSSPSNISANMVNIGSGFAANVGEIHWQRSNPAVTQVLPRVSPGGMSALATHRLGMMSQPLRLRSSDFGQPPPMPRKNQAPIAGGNGMSNIASVGTGTCSALAGELVERSDSYWSGTLYWPYADPPFHVQVVTVEPMGNPMASTWSRVLSLDTTSYKVPITELEKWMKENKAVLVRFEPASKSGEHNFAQLVEELREKTCYAVASWEIQGKGGSTPNLLLAPFGQGLLGAAFPVTGTPDLPPQPRQTTQRDVDPNFGDNILPVAPSTSGDMGHLEELPSALGSQANVIASRPPARPISPQQVQQRELQAQQNLHPPEVQPTVPGGSGAGVCDSQDEGLSNAGFEWGASSVSGDGVVRETWDEICAMLGLDDQFTM